MPVMAPPPHTTIAAPSSLREAFVTQSLQRLWLPLLCAAALPALAAEALPPAAPSKPVSTVRVGGSPADLAFRNAVQKSGDEYRAARAACAAGAKAERAGCQRTARATLRQQQQAARAAHDAAR